MTTFRPRDKLQPVSPTSVYGSGELVVSRLLLCSPVPTLYSGAIFGLVMPLITISAELFACMTGCVILRRQACAIYSLYPSRRVYSLYPSLAAERGTIKVACIGGPILASCIEERKSHGSIAPAGAVTPVKEVQATAQQLYEVSSSA